MKSVLRQSVLVICYAGAILLGISELVNCSSAHGVFIGILFIMYGVASLVILIVRHNQKKKLHGSINRGAVD